MKTLLLSAGLCSFGSALIVDRATDFAMKPDAASSFAEVDTGAGSLAKAEAVWEANRRKTDELLAKVHEQMAALQTDIQKTQVQQKNDMVMLEKARKQEDADISATQEKLKELAKQPLTLSSKASSFLEGSAISTDDILAPLKKAADEARKFSENVRVKEKSFQELLKKEMADSHVSPSSFAEDDDESKEIFGSSFLDKDKGKDEDDKFSFSTEQADKNLALAQNELNKLAADIESQKKELEAESKKAAEDHAKQQAELAAQLKPISFSTTSDEAINPSFLQLSARSDDTTDPLSPASLVAWKEKFEENLHKALDIGKKEFSGFSHGDSKLQVPTPVVSFAELDNVMPVVSDDDLKKSQREVDRLREQFDEQMSKLRADNQKLLANARAEVQRSKEMKEQLEAERLKESSFIEKADTYDPSRAEERIKDLERKWKQSAAKLSMTDMTKGIDDETNSILEQAKARRAETSAKLDKLREQLSKDIERMHADIAKSKTTFKKYDDEPVSFLQEPSNEKNKEETEPAKASEEKTKNAAKDEKVASSDAVAAPDASTTSFDRAKNLLSKLNSLLNGAAKKADDEVAAEKAKVAKTEEKVTKTEEKVTKTEDKATKTEEKAASDSDLPALRPSFVEEFKKFKLPGESALAKAEKELAKLQEQLRANPVETFQKQFGRLPFQHDGAAEGSSDLELVAPRMSDSDAEVVRDAAMGNVDSVVV